MKNSCSLCQNSKSTDFSQNLAARSAQSLLGGPWKIIDLRQQNFFTLPQATHFCFLSYQNMLRLKSVHPRPYYLMETSGTWRSRHQRVQGSCPRPARPLFHNPLWSGKLWNEDCAALQLYFIFSHMNYFKNGAIRYMSQEIIHVNLHLHPLLRWEALLPIYIQHLVSDQSCFKFHR